MHPEADQYFLRQSEPVKSCLLAIRHIILSMDNRITEVWRYQMPFYCYDGKRFCYLWIQKNRGVPYLGIVEGKKIDHPDLIAEKRSRMKILLLDPSKNIPVRKIKALLRQAIHILVA